MASLHRPSLSPRWLAVILLAVMAGCASPRQSPAEPGELELHVEDGASYGVVGRFLLVGVEPGAGRRELRFDASTSRQRMQVPPGAYVLTLEAGATLACHAAAGEPTHPTAPSTRLVSSWPQPISIAPGAVTTARVGFGPAPVAGAGGLWRPNAALPPDPCGEAGSVERPEQVLSRR